MRNPRRRDKEEEHWAVVVNRKMQQYHTRRDTNTIIVCCRSDHFKVALGCGAVYVPRSYRPDESRSNRNANWHWQTFAARAFGHFHELQPAASLIHCNVLVAMRPGNYTPLDDLLPEGNTKQTLCNRAFSIAWDGWEIVLNHTCVQLVLQAQAHFSR